VFGLSLPESASLPSAGGFAERFLSGARQRRLCREPNKKHSAKPLHSAPALGKEVSLPSAKKKHSAKASLPSAKVKHSVKQFFKPCFDALNTFLFEFV
jgi:hypothetical protein